MTNEPNTFDPSRYLTLVSGKEYLEVKWRLVWLRNDHPDASITTQMLSHADNEAVFRATITLPSGASADGHGMEDSQGFGDYLEKAETKAIGRALAALGYGTQFAGDFEYGASAGRVVDSPVQRNDAQRGPQRQPEASRPTAGFGGASDKQQNAIRAMSRKLNVDPPSDAELAQMSRADASAMIERMQNDLNAGVMA